MAYNTNMDYAAAMQKTTDKTLLAELEAARNEKIAKEGLSQYTPTYNYTTKYAATTLPSSSSQDRYINDLYAAQQQANVSALKSAYDTNVAKLDSTAAKIPQTYYDAKNTAAAQAEQSKANFNEYAAAKGLNSGAAGQASLAMNIAKTNNLASLDQAKADALASVEQQRLSLSTEYQNAIAQAVAEGNASKAQSLYSEAVRIDESLVSTALNQASENYNAWQAAYTQNTAATATPRVSGASPSATPNTTPEIPNVPNVSANPINYEKVYDDMVFRVNFKGATADNVSAALADFVDTGNISLEQARQILINLGMA